MDERIKKYIFEGNYHLAEEICKNLEQTFVRDMLLTLVYDTDSISIYSFVSYMISQTDSPFWVELAVEIMIHPLCYIEGAYSVALFHSRELLKMEYNVKNLEMILFFYNIPEKLITIGEAKTIALELLEIEPDNNVALNILQS